MKLGAVPYLNALPLTFFLSEKPRLEVPAALDRLLKLGEIDLATAPIVTLFENPTYRLVPGIAIGTRGSVRSVRLVMKKPGLALSDVKSIYLDMESKTSAILLKVLLHFKFKRDLGEIRFIHPLPAPDVDAALLIGDKAITEAQANDLDLGYEWTSWTGLPFVFAAWIGREATCSPSLIRELNNCRDRSLVSLDQLCEEVPRFSPNFVKEYLTQNVSYLLGEEEVEGIRRFQRDASQLGLVPHESRLDFYTQ